MRFGWKWGLVIATAGLLATIGAGWTWDDGLRLGAFWFS